MVGASSGIGREVARLLASRGTRVVALSRREAELASLAGEWPSLITPIVHDVTDYDSVPAVFDQACLSLGGLDLIVYAAGVMPAVGPAEFDFEKDRLILEVNLLGAVAWLNLAAVRFGSAGHGSIVGIGSVAGDRGRRGQPAYNASKAALATYLEALRNRLDRLGVVVSTVKPGPVATPMTEGLGLRGAMPVAAAAKKVLDKANKPGEHYLKLSHRVIFFVIRQIPSLVFRRLKV